MADRSELIALLLKLRERADLDTGAEAQAARRKLRELMHKHGIRAADLKQPSRRAQTAPAARKPPPVRIRVQIGNVRIRWDL